MADVVIIDEEKRTRSKGKDINRFEVTGQIAKRDESKNLMNVSFSTSEKAGERTQTNHLTILVFDDAVREKFLSISIRNKVRISGYIQTSRPQYDEYGRRLAPVSRSAFERKKENDIKKAEEEGKKLYPWDIPRFKSSQFLVAKDVEAVENNTPDANIAEILGSVDSTFVHSSGQIRFSVHTSSGGVSVVSATLSPKEGVDYLPLMRQGARVKIIGHITSVPRYRDNGIYYDEKFAADSIEAAK